MLPHITNPLIMLSLPLAKQVQSASTTTSRSATVTAMGRAVNRGNGRWRGHAVKMPRGFRSRKGTGEDEGPVRSGLPFDGWPCWWRCRSESPQPLLLDKPCQFRGSRGSHY